MKKPLVAIVGRPNVGKSTLFNRLMGRRLAVVSEIPGTTRDRIIGDFTWGRRSLTLVDTGGLDTHPTSSLWEQVRFQIELAMEQAQCILFLTDATDGTTPADLEIAQTLRRWEKPVVVAVNKADNPKRAQEAVDFYRLGLGDPLPISAYHNWGIDDLMEQALATLPLEAGEEEEATSGLHLAIVGRPNVGKSLLLNAILGQERAIVHELPGTTRDALDTSLTYADQPLVLIDTAGIRRPGRIEPGIERYSALRAFTAIHRADVVFLVLDATELVAAQDTHIAGEVAEAFKGVVVLVNKWDLVPELGLSQEECLAEIRSRLRFMPYAPVCFVSALRREGIPEAMDRALAVYAERLREVPHSQVHSTVIEAMAQHLPPTRAGRHLSLRWVSQEGINPPTFVFRVNDPALVHFSYKRYLERRLRESLGFRWTHLRLVFQRPGER